MGILNSIIGSGVLGAVGKMAAGYGIYKTANYMADTIDDQVMPGYSIGSGYGKIIRGAGTVIGGGLGARGASQLMGKALTGIGMAITDKDQLKDNINKVTSKYGKRSQSLTKTINREEFLRDRDLKGANVLHQREAGPHPYIKNKKQRVKQNRARRANYQRIDFLRNRARTRNAATDVFRNRRATSSGLGSQAASLGRQAMAGNHEAMTGFGAGNIFTRAGNMFSDFSPFGLMGKGAGFVGKTIGAAAWGIAKAPVTVATDIARLGMNVSSDYRAGHTALSFADHGFHMTTANPLNSMGSRMAGWGAMAGAGELVLRGANEIDPTAGMSLMGKQEYNPTSGQGPRRMREDSSYYSTVGLVQALHTNR